MALPAAARASKLVCRQCRISSRRAAATSVSSRPFLAPSIAATITTTSLSSSPTSRSFSHTTTVRQDSSSVATPPKTHYDLFPQTLPSGPPPAGHFPIDLRALRREFLHLQSQYHPDLHPAGPQKTRAEATSALINDAFKTLSNPLLRAQYLLSLRGVDVANDETLKIEEPDLLGLVLEAREEIEDAEEEEELEGPRRENDERIGASEEVLERAFREDDVEAAKREAVRLRYWVNIKESLDNWEKGKPVVLQH
ncbi:dnaJ domain-containing protein [Sarocladium implicatum]|nr:dnaJ domain-containing protein [Sarocladium implicatum]